MRSTFSLLLAALAGGSVWGFTLPLSLRCVQNRANSGVPKMVYIPDGLSPEEWKKIQKKEKDKTANLGRVGPVRFKSRSFKAWQESGASHLFPVDPKKVERGEIPIDKVPYMQRGGAWDDSDLAKKDVQLKTSKKIVPKKWSDTDKKYAEGGYRQEQSVSIFGGASLPWANSKPIKGPPGLDTDNNRKVQVQKALTRPGTGRPMSADVKRRIEREAAEDRKKKEKLAAEIKSSGKKGLFGLW